MAGRYRDPVTDSYGIVAAVVSLRTFSVRCHLSILVDKSVSINLYVHSKYSSTSPSQASNKTLALKQQTVISQQSTSNTPTLISISMVLPPSLAAGIHAKGSSLRFHNLLVVIKQTAFEEYSQVNHFYTCIYGGESYHVLHLENFRLHIHEPFFTCVHSWLIFVTCSWNYADRHLKRCVGSGSNKGTSRTSNV